MMNKKLNKILKENNIIILDRSVEVPDIKIGALKYGGATLFSNGKALSYIKNKGEICFGDYNKLSFIIPLPEDYSYYIVNENREWCISNIKSLFGKENVYNESDFIVGSWVNDSLEIVYDKSLLVEFEVFNIDERQLRYILTMLDAIKKIHKQEAVALGVNGAMIIK